MKRLNSREDFSLCVQPCFLIGTYNEDNSPNFCPITWVSVTWDDDNENFLLIISMNGSKKTKENIARTNLLSANLVSTDMLELLDYFGTRSGKNGQKNEIHYEYENGSATDVPTLNISKWVYECEVESVVQKGKTTTYFCKIHNVQFDEKLKENDGFKDIDLTKLNPVIYSGRYHSLDKCLGKIGDFYRADS